MPTGFSRVPSALPAVIVPATVLACAVLAAGASLALHRTRPEAIREAAPLLPALAVTPEVARPEIARPVPPARVETATAEPETRPAPPAPATSVAPPTVAPTPAFLSPTPTLPPAASAPAGATWTQPITAAATPPQAEPTRGDPVTGAVLAGVWAPHPSACSPKKNRKGFLPAVINADGAWAGLTSCAFSSGRRMGNHWNFTAKCTSGKRRWAARVRIVVDGDRLVWSSEKGRTTYTRCTPATLRAGDLSAAVGRG